MKNGALIQLKTIDAQSEKLTRDSTTSMFHTVFQKKINFSKETICLSHKGNADFGGRVEMSLQRSGDMVSRCGLRLTLPPVPYGTECAWIEEIGNLLVKEASFEIGGKCIDKHFGIWMAIWNSLTLSPEDTLSYYNLTGNTSDLVGTKLGMITSPNPIPSKEIYIPLSFWFTRNISLALPLISMQSEQLPKIIVEFEQVGSLLKGDPLSVPDLHIQSFEFLAEYLFLSESERAWFARESFDMVIDQLHSVHVTSPRSDPNVSLSSFHHPLIEIVWVTRDTERFSTSDLSKSRIGFTDSDDKNPSTHATLKINNVERFSEQTGDFFQNIQPLRHHTSSSPYTGINVYSFSDNPESLFEYTGALYASSVDNIVLSIRLTDAAKQTTSETSVYARGYNTLSFRNGYARLKYIV